MFYAHFFCMVVKVDLVKAMNIYKIIDKNNNYYYNFINLYEIWQSIFIIVEIEA